MFLLQAAVTHPFAASDAEVDEGSPVVFLAVVHTCVIGSEAAEEEIRGASLCD